MGVGNEYRFEIRRPDGTVTVVEMPWEPVSVLAQEEQSRRSMLERQFRRASRNDGWTFDGAIPKTKPAFSSIFSDQAGRIYVQRQGAATAVEGECDEDGPSTDDPTGYRPCFRAESTIDVFDDNGAFLGQIDSADAFSFLGYRGATHWVGIDADPDGTILVKKYRLVIPADRADP